MTAKIPRHKENDYTRESAESRRQFVKEQTNAELNHVGQFSFEPEILQGNIENFIGVAQVPIGLAGPIKFAISAELRLERKLSDVI